MEQAARQTTPYEAIGGAAVFRRIVDRFYDLMESDPSYAELRAMHAADLAPMREALASFLSGWAGGPRDWFEANPGRCMFSVHSAHPIGASTADQWAQAMGRAIADAETANSALGAELAERLSMMAHSMAKD